MQFLRKLFGGSDTQDRLPKEANMPSASRLDDLTWRLNELGFPMLESQGWRFVATPHDRASIQLWQYSAVRNGSTEFSHYAPTEEMAKKTAELHLKMGRMPPLGLVELAPAIDEPFDIVGESKFQTEIESIAGPKTVDGANVQIPAFLMPEPENPFDPNAVAIVIADKTVGYLSRDDNEEFLEFLKDTGASGAFCGGIIEGGWKNSRSEGHFCVRLDIEWPPEPAS